MQFAIHQLEEWKDIVNQIIPNLQHNILLLKGNLGAGKTTFSEELLYYVGAIRRKGRVDHGDTLLDADEIERKRGITVFANQGAPGMGAI